MIFNKKRKIEKKLQSVPGPSPWYLHKYGPKIQNCKWVPAEDSKSFGGMFFLKRCDDILLILNMYNYVKLIGENYLLIWHQRYSKEGVSEPVNLKILDVTKMECLTGNIKELCQKMAERKISSAFNTPVISELELSTHVAEKEIEFSFPNLSKTVDELLILCRSSGIVGENEYSSNIGLMVVRPQRNSIKIFPQDWFNNSECDFDYQWITRVGRDKKTGEVYGDGIRISPFVLDESLRNIKKVFY